MDSSASESNSNNVLLVKRKVSVTIQYVILSNLL